MERKKDDFFILLDFLFRAAKIVHFMHICKKKCRNLSKFCTFCGCGIPVYRYIGIPNGLKESDGAVDEVGKGLAFELTGSQEGYVNELVETFVFAG